VRLRSLGSGHAPLNLLISEQSNTRQKYKDLIAAQVSVSQTLERWSQEEDNPALQDVLHQVCEINLLWAEAQRDFVGTYVVLTSNITVWFGDLWR